MRKSPFLSDESCCEADGKGDVIVNTSSITAYNGSPGLIDYASTKGAITSFTRSPALNLAN